MITKVWWHGEATGWWESLWSTWANLRSACFSDDFRSRCSTLKYRVKNQQHLKVCRLNTSTDLASQRGCDAPDRRPKETHPLGHGVLQVWNYQNTTHLHTYITNDTCEKEEVMSCLPFPSCRWWGCSGACSCSPSPPGAESGTESTSTFQNSNNTTIRIIFLPQGPKIQNVFFHQNFAK